MSDPTAGDDRARGQAPAPALAPSGPPRRREHRAGLIALLAGVATLPLLVGTTFPGFQFLIAPIFLLTIVVGYEAAQVHRELPWLIPLLIAVGLAVAVFSVVSGVLNGFSDEPYSTPAYASLGWSLYSKNVAFTYLQYGKVGFEDSYDVYLPLLTFVQVPGLDYRWVSLTAWAGTLYLLRKNPLGQAGFAT
ncbi:MAG: hypothetical protein ACREDE_08535, partial [Thermoplasmata archaeon]